MEKKLIFLIFFLALFIRLYKLGTFPVGFHIDEAKVAWNSLSILKTGKDDLGNTLPLYYNTFGDYRPTGIFYFTIPFIIFLGRNIFAVRFSSALFGALTVFPLYYFVSEIEKYKHNNDLNLIGVAATILLTLSPWHIETSRATNEVIISTFFTLLFLLYFIKGINRNKIRFFVYSALALIISILLYHSIRLLAPIFILLIIIFKKDELKNRNTKRSALLFFAFSLVLFLIFLISPAAKGRFSQVSIASDVDTKFEISEMIKQETGPHKNFVLSIFHSPLSIYAGRAVTEYANYFSSGFLLGNATRPYRYITPGVGLLTFAEAALLILGLISVIRYRKNGLVIALFLASPIPAALTTEDSPNLNRTLIMIIFLVIIEAYGIILTFKSLKFGRVLLLTIFALWFLNFTFFIHMYLIHSEIHRPLLLNVNMDSSSYRNIGAIQLAYKLDSLKNNYSEIIVTNFPDDPYPWYAFFTSKEPSDFNKYAELRTNGPWNYKNILFSQSKCPSDSYFDNKNSKNILIVDSGECLDEVKIKDGRPMKITDTITRPDGSQVYVFIERI